MPYDVELADRLRARLSAEPGIIEKRMFGGVAFLAGGHLAVGASSKGGLMLRVDPAETESLLAEPRAESFEMRGKPVSGWLRVDLDGSASQGELDRWVARGLAYARSLSPK